MAFVDTKAFFILVGKATILMQELERATLVERLVRLKTYSFDKVSHAALLESEIKKIERCLAGKPPRAVRKPKKDTFKKLNWEKIRLASLF